MSHFNGFVVCNELNNPFEYCDVVTMTTHKLLRGPRSAVIFSKKELSDRINFSVFPSIQGGPHNNQIAALCTQLKEVQTEKYHKYIKQVKSNAKILAETLIRKGYNLSTNGTDTHLVLLNVRDKGLTGSKVEKICEYVNISLNKNSIYGDKSAVTTGGIRLGTPWMSSRGCQEEDFIMIANFLDRVINIALKIQESKGKLLKDFVKEFDKNEDLQELKKDVQIFMNKINKK